jgi:hypothetical protein
LWELAAEFARRSPDWETRASLKLIHAGEIGGPILDATLPIDR